MRLFSYIFQNQDLPKWIVRLNYLSLAGIIAWPLVFFGSIFMFDDPNNDVDRMSVYFILLNCYPVGLLLFSFLSFKLFRFSPVFAAIFPSIPLLAYLCTLILILFS